MTRKSRQYKEIVHEFLAKNETITYAYNEFKQEYGDVVSKRTFYRWANQVLDEEEGIQPVREPTEEESVTENVHRALNVKRADRGMKILSGDLIVDLSTQSGLDEIAADVFRATVADFYILSGRKEEILQRRVDKAHPDYEKIQCNRNKEIALLSKAEAVARRDALQIVRVLTEALQAVKRPDQQIEDDKGRGIVSRLMESGEFDE